MKENGKVALDFGGTSQLDFTTIAKVDVDPFAVFTVAQDTPNNLLFVDSTDNQNDALLVFTSYGQMRSRWNGSVYIDFINSDSLYRLFSVIDDGTNPVNYYYSGELVTDAAYPVTNKAINLNRIGGTGYQASQQYAGIMQEAFFTLRQIQRPHRHRRKHRRLLHPKHATARHVHGSSSRVFTA